jgi:hypothetical protein
VSTAEIRLGDMHESPFTPWLARPTVDWFLSNALLGGTQSCAAQVVLTDHHGPRPRKSGAYWLVGRRAV